MDSRLSSQSQIPELPPVHVQDPQPTVPDPIEDQPDVQDPQLTVSHPIEEELRQISQQYGVPMEVARTWRDSRSSSQSQIPEQPPVHVQDASTLQTPIVRAQMDLVMESASPITRNVYEPDIQHIDDGDLEYVDPVDNYEPPQRLDTVIDEDELEYVDRTDIYEPPNLGRDTNPTNAPIDHENSHEGTDNLHRSIFSYTSTYSQTPMWRMPLWTWT